MIDDRLATFLSSPCKGEVGAQRREGVSRRTWPPPCSPSARILPLSGGGKYTIVFGEVDR